MTSSGDLQVLEPAQVAAFERDGFLVLPGVVAVDTCAELVARAEELVEGWDPAEVSIFTTDDQTRTTDDYFLTSGPEIRFFTERDALAPDGSLRVPKQRALNKIGHALHDLDPLFSAFSRQPLFASLIHDVGLPDPLLLQSMYIFKGPHIGGEVTSHQDATFLWTDPVTVTGIWVALQDATVANGCLWALPGGHRTTPLASRFVRAAEGGTAFEPLAPATPDPADGWVPLEAPAGSVVLLHGLLPHRSSANTSAASRHAYSVHVVSESARYPQENWLQRPTSLPLRGF